MEDRLKPSEVNWKRLLRDITFKMCYSSCIGCEIDVDLVDMVVEDNTKRFKKTVVLSEQEKIFLVNKVKAIIEKQDIIDKIIESFLISWKMDRISYVDLSILRMSVYDLVFEKNTPVNVIISEAVVLAGKFDDEKAKAFINGILSSLNKKFTVANNDTDLFCKSILEKIEKDLSNENINEDETFDECIQDTNEAPQTDNEFIQVTNEAPQTDNECIQVTNEAPQTDNECIQVTNKISDDIQ